MAMDFEFGNKSFCPRIDVSYMAQMKMDMYVEIAQKEVGWYGLVERTGESTFYIHDVYMIEQEVNAATTEIDPMGLAKLKTTLWKSGIINAENQSKIGLYLWGHSHVNMGTGPSGQDNSQTILLGIFMRSRILRTLDLSCFPNGSFSYGFHRCRNIDLGKMGLIVKSIFSDFGYAVRNHHFFH